MLRNNAIVQHNYMVCVREKYGNRNIACLTKREADQVADAYARCGFEATITKERTWCQLRVNVLPCPTGAG